MDPRKDLTNQTVQTTVKPVEQPIAPGANVNQKSINAGVVKTELVQKVQSPLQQPSALIKESMNVNQREHPYFRAVAQPLGTGVIIGFSFYPIQWAVTNMQKRPAGVSVLEYFQGMMPQSKPNQYRVKAFLDVLRANSKYIGKGMTYSCTTSFAKSVFTCQGPTVQKRLEQDFEMFYGKDFQDPTILQEQTPFRVIAKNKWLLTGGISTALGGMESAITSGAAARGTCAMLKKDIMLHTYFDKVKFNPGIGTRTIRNGVGQFTFLTGGHLAESFKKTFPESQFGPFAILIGSGIAGVGGALGNTFFDNIYTHQINAIKEVKKGTYKVPSLPAISKTIVNEIGWKGLARGGVANMITTPIIYSIAHSINELFNNPNAPIYRVADSINNLFDKKNNAFNSQTPSQASKGSKLFGFWKRKPEESATPAPQAKPQETQTAANKPKRP